MQQWCPQRRESVWSGCGHFARWRPETKSGADFHEVVLTEASAWTPNEIRTRGQDRGKYHRVDLSASRSSSSPGSISRICGFVACHRRSDLFSQATAGSMEPAAIGSLVLHRAHPNTTSTRPGALESTLDSGNANRLGMVSACVVFSGTRLQAD